MALGRIFGTVYLLTCLIIQTRGVDKYTDENRPYEFGFSIEGEQHRHEKKDEKGLIMGEFGFVTADGVYHVTVYATDEQGRFKILSMKNIRVKPYPTYKQSTPSRQGHSLDLEAPQQALTPQVSSTPAPFKKISIQPPQNSCSSCSIPTTSTQAPVGSNILAPAFSVNNNFNPQYPQQTNDLQNFPGSQISPQLQVPQGNPSTYPNQELAPPQSQPQYPQTPNAPGQFNSQGGLPNYNSATVQQNNYPAEEDFPPNSQQKQPQRDNLPSARTPKLFDGDSPQAFGPAIPGSNFNQPATVLPKKPVLISAQMQIVDKNTDIYRRGPGEKEGLPKGLTKDDMSNLLYTFNYTVGFHGHFEEGYTNGVKQGYYFITGRNGVRTRVDYVADSNGFRPKITQEVLDLLSEDVPKPETEKDAKYGLKGYEFKWLYYPIESKGR